MYTYSDNKFRHIFYKELCKKCGVCIQFCPREVLKYDSEGFPFVAYLEKCNGCTMCFLRCPDFALEVEKNASRK